MGATGSFTESIVEDATLAWLAGLGDAVLSGPDIAAGEPGAERSDRSNLCQSCPAQDCLVGRSPARASSRLKPRLGRSVAEATSLRSGRWGRSAYHPALREWLWWRVCDPPPHDSGLAPSSQTVHS